MSGLVGFAHHPFVIALGVGLAFDASLFRALLVANGWFPTEEAARPKILSTTPIAAASK